MPQIGHRDLEHANTAPVDEYGVHPQSTPDQPLHGEYNFGDSSGPFFSMYSKATDDEDNKMVERWQKDADGILIFTGLFSAAVAALLSVTVQDLRPNSQDTSAFYLGNIYEVLANPNATHSSLPPPVVKPPPFSAPRYAVLVNILWFLSLVISLSCALLATSLHQWARRYIRLTQPARRSPEKRARKRAFFSNGVDKMHIPWAVEGLPTLLHLSVFLFFGGLAIFLFNIDQEVSIWVVWWIGLFSFLYGLITLMPMIRQDSPYSAPLSTPAWFLYSSILYLTFKVLAFIISICGSYRTWDRYDDLKDRYRGWMLGGVEKKAEETASEQSSEIDVRILGWTISALGDDDSLEKFFESIPGLFNSNLAKNLERDFPETLLKTFWSALDEFIGRTLSSNSVTEAVKSRRVVICRDIISMMPCTYMHKNLRSHFDQIPVSIERLQAMARWFTHTSRNVSYTARYRIAKNLARIQERDDRWIALASNVFGLPELKLRQNVALGGDNVFLATLIDTYRRGIRFYELGLVEALTQFDIRHTLPRLQHDFCSVWNEAVHEARNSNRSIVFINILYLIRQLYIALHQGTDAAPTAFSASTDSFNFSLLEPSSFPLCEIASHLPDSTAHVPVHLLGQSGDSSDASPHHSASGGSAFTRQVKEATTTPRLSPPPHPMLPSELGDHPQASATTSFVLPVHTTPHPTDALPEGVVAVSLQDIPPAATLFYPLEGTTQRDIIAPFEKPGIRENLSIAPASASTPPVLSESLASCDEGAASTSSPLLPISSAVGFSIPASLPTSSAQLLPNAEILALGSTSPPYPTGNATLSRLHARGLMNTGNVSFANSMLQLLVHSPPFRNIFREVGDLKAQYEAGGLGIGVGATPLVDATMRFFEEFVYKDESPPTQQPSPQAAGGKLRDDEAAKKEHNVVDSFEPTYMYDAMKEKRQLKSLPDGGQQDTEEGFRLYLDALDEELHALLVSGHKSVTASPRVEERVVSQSGQTEVGKRGLMASLVESPISRIFGGRFRSIIRAPNQPDTVTVEDWRSLRLNIQPDSVHTIQDLLVNISQAQPLQVGQSSLIDASQQVLFEILPPVLVLHLKRFMYDATTDGIDKISKPIHFEPELEIPSEIMAPIAGKSAQPTRYKLYGVLYHRGKSSGSEHYTVDVLHHDGESGSGEAWLRINDEVVSVVRQEDVFSGHENELGDGRFAYMLLYCRIAPT